MSAANLSPAQNPGNGAAAPAAAAPAGSAAGSTGNSLFDAILMLEEMAAAPDAGIDAGAAELGADGTEISTGDGADDEENLESDDPLAFLAGLIALLPHAAARPQGAGADGSSGGNGGADGAAALAPPAPTAGDDAAAGNAALTGAGTNVTDGKSGDAAAAARALAAQAALGGDSSATDDKSVAPRAVDLLTHTSRPAPAPADHPPIATHVRDPRWAEEFGARIALLVNQRESVAALSLTPVDLGPVDVSITVRDSQATIHFGAAQADTRALIEASLPKLRELLAAQGFQLMDASVSQGFTRQSKSEAPSIARPGVEEVTAVESRPAVSRGLLDTYA